MKKTIIIIATVLIMLLIISASLVIYFNPELGKLIGLGCKTMNWNKSFCIDRLPDFPEAIGEFSLHQYSKKNWESECNDFNEESFCSKSIRVEYRNEDTHEEIHFMPVYLTKGKKSTVVDYMINNLIAEEVEKNVFRLVEPWELFWSTDTEFDYIMTQTYLYELKDDGSTNNKVQTAEADQEVIQYFLNKYPPAAKK